MVRDENLSIPTTKINGIYGNFPGRPVVKILVSTAGGGVRSLIEKLSYHMWHNVGGKKIIMWYDSGTNYCYSGNHITIYKYIKLTSCMP